MGYFYIDWNCACMLWNCKYYWLQNTREQCGIANIIDYKTLENSDIIRIVVSFVIGFTTIVFSINHIQKKILEMLIEKTDTREQKNNTNTLIFNKKVYNQGPKIVVIGGGRLVEEVDLILY